ncbi:MAG: PDZ domain-containing protein [Planctomycetaceae bacterium]|nr:PDZ domain-containing protein [Planctomycetaceae bacterium]
MLARTMALWSGMLAIAPCIMAADPPPAVVIETESRSTREAKQDDADRRNQELGWELAAVENGVRVERISKNSPAAEAHLEENDVVISVAGQNVLTPERVREILASVVEAGEKSTDVVVRRDGKELSYLLSLEAMTPVGRTSSQTTVRVSQTDLVQMIQQLQDESRQQHALLQSLLLEVQTLRAQLGVPANGGVNAPTPGAVVPGAPVRPRVGGTAPAAPVATP